MIRRTVAITIFAASLFAAGCSSSDDDSGVPSSDDLTGADTPVAGADDAFDDAVDDVDGLIEADAEPTVPAAPGEDVVDTPTSGPGADDAATVDGAPLDPTVDETTPGDDAVDPDAVEGGTETAGTDTGEAEAVDPDTGETETADTDGEGVVAPPPGVPGADDQGGETAEGDPTDDTTDTDTPESNEGDAQPLTAALAGLDGNPEGGRASITRQLLENTEFGVSLDGSDAPFTMFVPTDTAFINLGMNLEQLLDDPELANTLQFHIVQGEALDRAALNARSGQNLTMSNGQSNPLSQNGESLQIGSATITDAPEGGRVRNGVFYLIDQVLIPATGE